MTKLVEVRRIPVVTPFDYPAAKAEIDDAINRGDEVDVDGRDIVVRTKVFVRRGRAA